MRLLPILLLLAPAACDVDRLFVGDSITEMSGYVERVAAALPHETVVRAACGGTTTWQWSLDVRVPGFHCATGSPLPLYDLLVKPWGRAITAYVLLGTNDSSFHAAGLDETPIHPDAYAAYLAALITRLQDDGARTVVLIAPPDVQDPTALERNSRLALYRERIRELCRYFPGVVCGPDLSQILDGPGDFVDRVHPSPWGHAKIAAALLE